MKRILTALSLSAVLFTSACGTSDDMAGSYSTEAQQCIDQGFTPGTEQYKQCRGQDDYVGGKDPSYDPEWQKIASLKGNRRTCYNYGFKLGSEKFAECLMLLDIRDEQQRQQSWSDFIDSLTPQQQTIVIQQPPVYIPPPIIPSIGYWPVCPLEGFRRHMKHILSALTLSLVLIGCGGNEMQSPRQKAVSKFNRMAQFKVICEKQYGFERDSKEHKTCVMELDQNYLAEKAAEKRVERQTPTTIILPTPQTTVIQQPPVYIPPPIIPNIGYWSNLLSKIKRTLMRHLLSALILSAVLASPAWSENAEEFPSALEILKHGQVINTTGNNDNFWSFVVFRGQVYRCTGSRYQTSCVALRQLQTKKAKWEPL